MYKDQVKVDEALGVFMTGLDLFLRVWTLKKKIFYARDRESDLKKVKKVNHERT